VRGGQLGNLGDSTSIGGGGGGGGGACSVGDPCGACFTGNSQSSASVSSLTPVMHEAYELVPILEKLPRQIESIACYSERQRVHSILNVL